MAAPIAHIFLALQVLNGTLKDNKYNEKEFIIGTSFPDIRYLKVITRDKTHFKNVTFNDIKNEKDSFKAGMLFHSFVDEKREEYVIKNKIYEKLPNFKFITQVIKFGEDQFLLDFFDIKKYVQYFEGISKSEMNFKISDHDLKRWHNFLIEYFDLKMNTGNLIMKYFDLNKPNAWFITRFVFSYLYVKKSDNALKKILSDENIKKVLLQFYLNFEKEHCF